MPDDIDIDLSGLGPDQGDIIPMDGEPSLEDLQAQAKDLIWEAGEMDPPADIAYSLHRLDDAASQMIEHMERQAAAAERIAVVLEKAFEFFSKPSPI